MISPCAESRSKDQTFVAKKIGDRISIENIQEIGCCHGIANRACQSRREGYEKSARQAQSISAVEIWYSLVRVEGSRPVGAVQLSNIFEPPLMISSEP